MTKAPLLCALFLVLSAPIAQGANCKLIYLGPLASDADVNVQVSDRSVSLDGETAYAADLESCESGARTKYDDLLNREHSANIPVNNNRYEKITIVVKDVQYFFEARGYASKLKKPAH